MVAGGRELIDTLWNVNVRVISNSLDAVSELIETLWNVNFKVVLYEVDGYTELIETLWNVNNDTITEPNKLKMN